MAELDRDFVEYVVKAMVDHPEDVKTDRKVDEMGVLITLSVNPQDMGNVIGRSGQAARALRTLLRSVGAKNNARVNLKIAEPPGSTRPVRAPFAQQQAATTSTDDLSADVEDLKL